MLWEGVHNRGGDVEEYCGEVEFYGELLFPAQQLHLQRDQELANFHQATAGQALHRSTVHHHAPSMAQVWQVMTMAE